MKVPKVASLFKIVLHSRYRKLEITKKHWKNIADIQ